MRNRTHPVKPYIYPVIIVQSCIGVGFSLLCYKMFDLKSAYSALSGTAVAVIANGAFVKKAFAITGASAARKIVNNFYQAEIIKIIISVILFVFCFGYVRVEGPAFFAAYCLLQLSVWLAPLFLSTKNRLKL